MSWIDNISPEQPVLIAGPTASGKSGLALEIADRQGGVIVNADALQVFDGWRVLTARPDAQAIASAPHALYGHVPFAGTYSVGDWLRDLVPLLAGVRPIITGGTGLYFRAAIEGLAEIPATPDTVRISANARIAAEGHGALLAELHPETARRLDPRNPMRVARAWEVQTATGRPLHAWQDETPPPLLALASCAALVLDAPKAWLDPRIARRFDAMIEQGALEEARALSGVWDPGLAAAKAIGAPELMAHLNGTMSMPEARSAAITATRQYAKRQRTWFRARMGGWRALSADSI
jgi:tRNA dimethylallyltransferase